MVHGIFNNWKLEKCHAQQSLQRVGSRAPVDFIQRHPISNWVTVNCPSVIHQVTCPSLAYFFIHGAYNKQTDQLNSDRWLGTCQSFLMWWSCDDNMNGDNEDDIEFQNCGYGSDDEPTWQLMEISATLNIPRVCSSYKHGYRRNHWKSHCDIINDAIFIVLIVLYISGLVFKFVCHPI